jgi:hypothetical protein
VVMPTLKQASKVGIGIGVVVAVAAVVYLHASRR